MIAVFNPLEKMLTFADANTADAASGSSPVGNSVLLLDGIASVLARYTFVLHPSPRPTVFLTWLIVPGIVYAWSRGEKQAAVQALLLLLAAIGIDTLGVRRGLKTEYFIFTDPLIILAGAILLDSLSDLRFHKWTYPVAAGPVRPAYRASARPSRSNTRPSAAARNRSANGTGITFRCCRCPGALRGPAITAC